MATAQVRQILGDGKQSFEHPRLLHRRALFLRWHLWTHVEKQPELFVAYQLGLLVHCMPVDDKLFTCSSVPPGYDLQSFPSLGPHVCDIRHGGAPISTVHCTALQFVHLFVHLYDGQKRVRSIRHMRNRVRQVLPETNRAALSPRYQRNTEQNRRDKP